MRQKQGFFDINMTFLQKSYNILKSKLILNLGVKTQIRAYPFYKAPELASHKKILSNSIDF